MSKKRTKKKIIKLHGQARPADSATAVFWRDNSRFAEVFNKTILNDCEIDPDNLHGQDTSESALIKVAEGMHISLKELRDVTKSVSISVDLAILGLENQTYIDYLMPFRTLSVDFINYSAQVRNIQNSHKKNEYKPDENEVLSNFYKTDRLTPVITLVIYYGKEPWNSPTKFSDLYADSPYKKFALDHPMYLLDVRKMTDEQINDFSIPLKSFFGFLKYENENTDELVRFVNDNSDYFKDLPPETMNALAAITKSPELLVIQKENRNPEGGFNMCNGIQYYANQVATKISMETARQAYIESAQDFGHSISDTINKFIVKFNVTEEEAQADIKKYWKET